MASFFKANSLGALRQEALDIKIFGGGKFLQELGSFFFSKFFYEAAKLDNRCLNSLIPFALSAL